MRALGIEGAWVLEPRVFSDPRGTFHEWFTGPAFAAALRHPLGVAQANCSVSVRGTLRGVHFADVPPGQAKYVTCVRGSVIDVVVDIRRGSPTFRQWEAVELGERHHRAVYLAEGLGHAFMALTDDATVVYLCSAPYTPDREHGIHPLDPALGVDWPTDIEPLLSEKDAAAPTLREAAERGLLPEYGECLDWYGRLREDQSAESITSAPR
ncbi:dTDP-4-dehydrorhamnose 3,5-epimerase [Streptomyces sp. CA-288835]|uniref:dTDP-4-dehydrorhamnose 3,5-epimerase n=1 Tax=Streptomyces sp. CA-288835 TaxID=3240069 RepID=UPI003D92C32C